MPCKDGTYPLIPDGIDPLIVELVEFIEASELDIGIGQPGDIRCEQSFVADRCRLGQRQRLLVERQCGVVLSGAGQAECFGTHQLGIKETSQKLEMCLGCFAVAGAAHGHFCKIEVTIIHIRFNMAITQFCQQVIGVAGDTELMSGRFEGIVIGITHCQPRAGVAGKSAGCDPQSPEITAGNTSLVLADNKRNVMSAC